MRSRSHRHHLGSNQEEMHAYIFGMVLLGALLVSFIAAFAFSGPIILGTEMNTNGMVEYLCLGNGCNDLRRMDW